MSTVVSARISAAKYKALRAAATKRGLSISALLSQAIFAIQTRSVAAQATLADVARALGLPKTATAEDVKAAFDALLSEIAQSPDAADEVSDSPPTAEARQSLSRGTPAARKRYLEARATRTLKGPR